MKKFLIFAGVGCVAMLAALCPSLNAQTGGFSWVTGPDVVTPGGFNSLSLEGTHFDAVNFGAGGFGPVTVSNSAETETINFRNSQPAPFFPKATSSALFGTGYTTGDNVWDVVLQTAATANTFGSIPTIEIDGLTAGRTYQVEIFVYDSEGGSNGQSVFFPDQVNTGSGGSGEWTDPFSSIGTFTALGSTQELGFGGYLDQAIVNGYIVRDVTVAVPEPSSLAMLGSLLGAIVAGRRK